MLKVEECISFPIHTLPFSFLLSPSAGRPRELKQLALLVLRGVVYSPSVSFSLCLSLSLSLSRVLECISSHQLSVLSREGMGEWEAAVYIEGRRPKCCWRPKGLVLRDEMGHSYSSFHLLFFFFCYSFTQHQLYKSCTYKTKDGRFFFAWTPFRNWQFLKNHRQKKEKRERLNIYSDSRLL